MYQPDYKEIMNTTQTPAYVFDVDKVMKRIDFIKDILGTEIDICYAMKANPFIIGSMKNKIDCYEVCSPGEFSICERANVPLHKVVLSGVYKEEADIEYVVKTYGNQITYTCESVNQFHFINMYAEKYGLCVRVLLRITTGNQFGMDEEDLCNLIEHRKTFNGVDIVGLQHFSGTQRKKISKYEEELVYLDEFMLKLKEAFGFEAKELEFGPGFYVEYFKNAKPYNEKELLEQFKATIDKMKFNGHITLELGRFIAATCGTYYTKVVDMKRNADINFLIIDGGMHQLVYYGQMMAMKIPEYRQIRKSDNGNKEVNCNICGSLCTINDNIVKGLPLISPQVGDILEFQNTGAYVMTEGISLFLSRDLPKIFVYSEKDKLELMRDTFETNVLNYKVI